jgi:putative ABC transport system permease protein
MSRFLASIRPRWRKVLSDLKDNKMRTVLVVASIAVGVFAVGTLGTTFMVISQDMTESYVSINPANIEIWTTPFQEDFVNSVENIPGVANAEGRQVFGVRISQDNEAWQAIDVMVSEDFEASEIFLRLTVDGEPIPSKRELVIEKQLLDTIEVEVGDELQVRLPDGTIRTMPVTGIVQDQSSAGFGFNALPLVYVSWDTLEWLGRPENFNRLYATISSNSDDELVIQKTAEVIEAKLERSGRESLRTQVSKTSEHPMATTVQAVLGVLAALGILVMLLSASLIANTLNALLNQHLRQIGVMKLIGARSFQILGMYLVLILSFGVIALVLAVPLGAVAGYALSEFMANQLNISLLGFRVVPEIVILQILGALMVPLVAGFIPVRNGSKTTVRKAISDDRPGQQTNDTSWMDRLGAQISWLSRPILLSIRNTFRRKGRLALTLFTLTMAGAIFIAVFNVRASMGKFLDQVSDLFLADVTLNFERPYRATRVEQAVRPIPGVAYVEAWSAASAEILSSDDSVAENLQILAPPADSTLINPEMVAGRWLVPGEPNALVISDSIWDEYPDLKPGDTLPISVQGNSEEDWTIVGIFRFSSNVGDQLAYADYDTLSAVLNTPNKALSYRVVTEGHTLEDQERVGIALDRQLRAQGFKVVDAEPGLATIRDASEGINILAGFLMMMALLTALVGSIGLAGTMGMNVLERTREIGVMRAIGAVDLEIIKSVVIEGIFIGMISWVLGALLSFPITLLLLQFLGVAFSAPIPPTFTIRGFLVWMVAVLILATIASVLPARNAARLTIREVLAYE